MRIHLDPATTHPVAAPPVDTSQAASIAAASSTAIRGPGNSASGDSIAISGTSAALSQIANQRAARLESLSAAVSSGAYQVSSSAISGAIVAHAAAKS
jgi:anti-sigma28 factor (negative regulator of flagellin synthesis)